MSDIPSNPPQDGDAPKSPGAVKKTNLKTPREIELEKSICRLEDSLKGLLGWRQEVDKLLADSGVRPHSARPSQTADSLNPAKISPRGFLYDVGKDLGLED